MSEDSDMEKAIKETSILEEYSINWTQKLGAGISGPVRVCVKKSTQERFALKILLDRPKARNEAGENEDEKLNEVMQEAWKYNRECKLLRDALQSFSWNGRGFTDKVDRLKLAEVVKQ